MNYRNAPYFDRYADSFEKMYHAIRNTHLSVINYKFIVMINSILGITTKISWSTAYRSSGRKTEKLIDICKKTGADEYVSGPSAQAYLDAAQFKKNSIRLTWMDYSGYPIYNQLYPPFVHQVSIIDLIFNTGPKALIYMKKVKK